MTNRTCAVCGQKIYHRDICTKCYNEWCIDENGKQVIPNWLNELIRIQSSFERKYATTKEIPFTLDGRDMLGEKIEEFSLEEV